jgi:hypothetical protein
MSEEKTMDDWRQRIDELDQQLVRLSTSARIAQLRSGTSSVGWA